MPTFILNLAIRESGLRLQTIQQVSHTSEDFVVRLGIGVFDLAAGFYPEYDRIDAGTKENITAGQSTVSLETV